MKSITSLIIIVVSLALLYFYAWPQWQSVPELRSKHAALREAESKAQELSKLRNDLMTRYNAIPLEEMEKINKVVPVDYNPVVLAADISAMALRNSMVIKNVAFVDAAEVSNPNNGAVTEAPPQTPYKVVEVSFATEGQYKNFISLLSDLEKNIQILDIKKIDIMAKPSQDRGGVPSLDFKVTLDTYWIH